MSPGQGSGLCALQASWQLDRGANVICTVCHRPGQDEHKVFNMRRLGESQQLHVLAVAEPVVAVELAQVLRGQIKSCHSFAPREGVSGGVEIGRRPCTLHQLRMAL